MPEVRVQEMYQGRHKTFLGRSGAPISGIQIPEVGGQKWE